MTSKYPICPREEYVYITGCCRVRKYELKTFPLNKVYQAEHEVPVCKKCGKKTYLRAIKK